MSEFPLGYEKIAPATWVYLSSLLMIGLYFKFNRFWSVRNLDLGMLILLAPGLLMIQHGHEQVLRLSSELQQSTIQIEGTGDAISDEVDGEGTNGVESDGQNRVDGGSDSTGIGSLSPERSGDVEESVATSANRDIDSDSSNPRTQTEGDANESDVTDSDNESGNESGSTSDGSNRASDPEDESATETGEVDEERPLTPEQNVIVGQITRYQSQQRNGYILLFVIGILWLVRMLVDAVLVRRPLLEPNLTSPGLVFLGCSLLIFLVANVVTGTTSDEDLFGPQSARQMVQGNGEDVSLGAYKSQGPGYPLINLLPVIPTAVNVDSESAASDEAKAHRSDMVIAKSMAIISQLAIVLGLVFIGARHFNNFMMGAGASTLYLMLPYTAQMTGRVTHALPAALLIWAIASYRRPLLAGSFLGLAMGTVYYPIFLLPLWASFYWRRGLVRFFAGFAIMVLVLGVVLAFTATSFSDYLVKLSAMFGVWSPLTSGLQGIWALGWDSIYRLPILAAFIALSITFAFWPAQKNFGSLISCSCAIMVAVQFWHGFGGGLYMAWYLPLLLLTIFRPNLDDRVALTVLDESPFRIGRRPKNAAPRSAAA